VGRGHALARDALARAERPRFRLTRGYIIRGVADVFEVPVVEKGKTSTWTIVLTKPARHRVRLALTDGSGRTWEALGGDVFDALTRLRLEAERDGLQICCNGARRNAWCSGMQRDMGEGYVTYILEREQGSRQREARTLDPAPPGEVASVAEQRAFFEEWLGRPIPDLPELRG